MWKTIQLILILTSSICAYGQYQEIRLANTYLQNGEIEKARQFYDELSAEPSNIPHIHADYLNLLKQHGTDKEVRDYLNRIKKWYPNNLVYQVDELVYLEEAEEREELGRAFSVLLNHPDYAPYHYREVGRQLANRKSFDMAIQAYEEARDRSGSRRSFALEMARIYAYQNEKEKMVDEYLSYATQNSRNLNYIKNIFQDLLDDDEDLSYLENTLISRSQNEPQERMYAELLIWVELQRGNYYGAFVQARALDRRERSGGQESYEVGRMALNNQAWDDAIVIFEYLTKNYVQPGFNKLLIEAREEKIKNTYPVDQTAIRELSDQYETLYRERGPNRATLEGLKNQAELHAFYLGEIDRARMILERIIAEPRSGPALTAKSKLVLGDIFLLKAEPWEATLLYSQVEKSEKGEALAFEAKLRNAKLHYYIGNFALAKGHLDVLKQATTKDIANDAIDLSVLISDNTFLDSTDAVMQQFAHAELLLFQRRYGDAEKEFQDMLTSYPDHAIRDEVLWKLAKIADRRGAYAEAIGYLDKVISEFGYDVLSDDAAFQKAEWTHYRLNDRERARDMYQTFLTDHPGSRYAAEARKRFRQLRGDFGT